MKSESEDTHNLTRFVFAQRNIYARAISEIREGCKQTHWIWFVFPQFVGLGSSYESVLYAINSLDEARAYLEHPTLGTRLHETAELLLNLQGKGANEIFGPTDMLKLQSSMTLFGLVSDKISPFRSVIDKYYGGEPDEATLRLTDCDWIPTEVG